MQELCLDGFAELRAVRDATGGLADFEWVAVNLAAEQMLPRGPGPLVGRRLLRAAAEPDEARELFEHYLRAWTTGQPQDFELAVRRGDQPAWYRHQAVRAEGDGLWVACRDLTQWKLNEAALRKFLASLQAIFANTLHSFTFLDRTGRIQAFNQRAHQQAQMLFGKQMQIGLPIHDFVRPTEREGFDLHFAQALAGQAVVVERDLSTPGQRAAWFECCYAPVLGEGDAVQGVLFSALDITERKQQDQRRVTQGEVALRISLAGTVPELLAGCVAGAAALTGLAGGALYESSAGGGEFCLVEAPQPPAGWPALMPRVAASTPLGQLLSRGQSHSAPFAVVPGLLAGPLPGPWETVVLLPIARPPAAPACLVLAATGAVPATGQEQADLQLLATQAGAAWLRLRAQERERQLSRLQSRFLSLASHEFRNPLTVTAASAEMLEKNPPELTAARREELFELIRTSTRRILAMLDELLVIGRSEDGKEPCEPVPLDLAAVVRGFVDEARLADRGQHEFRFACPAPELPAVADARILRHILANLLTNAALYSAPGTVVETHLAPVAGALEISIRDHGCGIPLADRERVWEAFERGTNVTEQAGSGLGLYIARRMAELHGARLSCESEEGRGTTFVLRLPESALAAKGNP